MSLRTLAITGVACLVAYMLVGCGPAIEVRGERQYREPPVIRVWLGDSYVDMEQSIAIIEPTKHFDDGDVIKVECLPCPKCN